MPCGRAALRCVWAAPQPRAAEPQMIEPTRLIEPARQDNLAPELARKKLYSAAMAAKSKGLAAVMVAPNRRRESAWGVKVTPS